MGSLRRLYDPANAAKSPFLSYATGDACNTCGAGNTIKTRKLFSCAGTEPFRLSTSPVSFALVTELEFIFHRTTAARRGCETACTVLLSKPKRRYNKTFVSQQSADGGIKPACARAGATVLNNVPSVENSVTPHFCLAPCINVDFELLTIRQPAPEIWGIVCRDMLIGSARP